MSTSQAILFGAIGILVLLGAAFYGGMKYRESTFVNTPLIVTQTTNLDSLHNIWLAGKVDSSTLEDAYALIDAMKRRSPKEKHDTLIITNNVKIPVYSADTSLKATGQIVTTDTEDTTRSTFSTNVHMRLRWFPPPFALFQVQDISMDTIHTSFSRRRSVVTETTSDFPVSIEPTFGAGGHGAAIGGFVDIDNWSVGGLAIPEEKPLWLLKHRIIIFKGI